MDAFPLLDAAIEGFRLTRERPAAVGLWALLILLINLVTLGGLTALGLGAAMSQMNPFAAQPLTPQAAAAFTQAGIWFPLLALVQIVGDAVLYTAVMRAVLQPAQARFGYLRFGAQELRQIVLWLVGFALLFLYVTMLAAVFGLLSATGGDAGRLAAAAGAVVVFLGLFYPLVRLSLAPAATFAERRVVLFGAWKLSRGRFWSLVGCYVVAVLLASSVWLLSTVVVATLVYAVSMVGGGAGMVRAFEQLDLSSPAALLTAASLASLAVRAAVTALIVTILAAPAPVILSALSGPPAPKR